jgi:hypothetical protein
MAIDVSTAEGRVRLNVGDITDYPVLEDDAYVYFVSFNNNNENAATKQAAEVILAVLSQRTHERLDRLEWWGSEAFNNYLKFVEKIILNPNSSRNLAGVYAAGVDVEDVWNNITDPTVVHHPIPSYDNGDYCYPSNVF